MFNKTLVFLVGLIFSLFVNGFALAQTVQLDEKNLTQMLDYEIIVLKAELAAQTGDLEAFTYKFQELQNYSVPNKFLERYKTLEAFFNLETQPNLVGRGVFASANTAQNIVLLLPLSGDFALVGHAMQEVLERRLVGKRIHVLDTDIYDSMGELWNLVQMFEPSLIVGPLLKPQAEELAKYNHNLPNIVFSSLDNPEKHPNFLARASNNAVNARFFSEVFDLLNPSETSWIVDKSKVAQEQYDLATSLTSDADNKVLLQKIVIGQGVDKALSEAIGAEEASKRRSWLQHVVQTSLEFGGYVRQDKSLILILSEQLQAEQLAPLVKYHGLKTPVLWIPTELPSIDMFYNNLENWQETYALFPAHFLFQLSEIPSQNLQESQVGLFYALADLAIDLIEQANMPKPFRLNTQLGKVEVHSDGYYLMPRLVKLADNKLVYTELNKIYP